MAQSGTTYLARAARQPVRWQPWGRDAFALAARLDRPVLLYIGSDGCRWCAQSDREIYTDPEIGSMINALFVPVRVDRDERPDVAQHYQAAVEHLVGLHGWPLTVFLTADGLAFFGGTYFPADDPITGRGLKQLLPEIARSYHDQRPSIVEQAVQLQQLIRSSSGETRGALRPSLVEEGLASVERELAEAVRSRALGASVTHAEATALLLVAGDSTAQTVARRALDVILDSTAGLAAEDPPPLVRAVLATTLARAWAATGEPRYREAGDAVVRDLARHLADPDSLLTKETVFADQQGYALEHLLLAAAAFGESAAVRRGTRALDALLQRAYARGWGVRHAVDRAPTGPAPLGLLQDQVQVAAACLAAYRVSNDSEYLNVAQDLAAVIERAYADSQGGGGGGDAGRGGYFDVTDATSTSGSAPLMGRTKRVFDDVLPGPNAQAALVLANLATVSGDAGYRRSARKTLEAFAGAMQDAGIRSTTFLAAARETLEIR